MIAKSPCWNGKRTGRRRTILLSAGMVSFALIALAPSPSHAQSIDYGSLEQLFGEAVTTSATGSPQRATEVPANMEIITADEIRRSGADNIPDIRNSSPVPTSAVTAAQAEVSVRPQSAIQPASPCPHQRPSSLPRRLWSYRVAVANRPNGRDSSDEVVRVRIRRYRLQCRRRRHYQHHHL